jgi:hypothetical protein
MLTALGVFEVKLLLASLEVERTPHSTSLTPQVNTYADLFNIIG